MKNTNDAQSSTGNNNQSANNTQASVFQYIFSTPPRSKQSDDTNTISTLQSELDECRKNYSAVWEEIKVLKNSITLFKKEFHPILLDNRLKYSLIVPLAIFYGHQASHTMEYDSLSSTYEQVLIPSLVLFHLPVVLTPVMDSLNINIRIYSDLISQGLFLMYLSICSQNSLSNFGGSFLSIILLQTLLYLNRQSYSFLKKLDIKGCLSSAKHLERNFLESVKTVPFKTEITWCICFTVLAYFLNHRHLNKISLYIGVPGLMALANRLNLITSLENKHRDMIKSITVIGLAALPFVVEKICDETKLYERYNQNPDHYYPFNLYALNGLPCICYALLTCGASFALNIYEEPAVDRLTKSLMLVISSCFLGSKLIPSDIAEARSYLHIFGGQHFFSGHQEAPSIESMIDPGNVML